eukprot:1812588-Prymnesium_polylepis.1
MCWRATATTHRRSGLGTRCLCSSSRPLAALTRRYSGCSSAWRARWPTSRASGSTTRRRGQRARG